MKKKDLPVSRRLYADICSRVSTVLAGFEDSLREAVRMVDSYICGGSAESDDMAATVAFGMVRVELDRGMERSRRARERGAKRRAEKEEREKREARKEAGVRPAPLRSDDPKGHERLFAEALEEYDRAMDRLRAVGGGEEAHINRTSFLNRYMHCGREYTLHSYGIIP